MKFLKVILMIMIVSMIGVLSISCASGSDSAAVLEDQVVTVQRGDLTIDITAVGNLALSLKEELAFEIAGTVAEVLVEEADSVEEGQVLARLDTSEWEDQLSLLEDRVTAAERQVTAAERQVPAKERDLIQAEINLKNAEIALEQTKTTYSVADFKVAQADVDETERNLEETLRKLSNYDLGTQAYENYQKMVIQADARLNTVQAKLDAMLSGFDTEEVAIKKLQLEIVQGKLEDAQITVADVQVAIADARKDVEDAKKTLDDALEVSTEIIAPFAGFITRVNIGGGDEVKKGTVAVILADPTKFEADILVSEMDIFQLRLGGDATVQVDAMPGMSLPARVTHISPTATIQQGVVNYEVKVEIELLRPIRQEQPETGQEAMPPISSGELSERIQQALEDGRITQEQAEEMTRRMQQGEGGLSGRQRGLLGGQPGGQRGLPGGQPGQIPTMLPVDFQLREGLTVTVSILVEERRDVLLVPNQAIIRRGVETYVQVLEDGVIEERSIQIGISDWQYTEAINGLSEGEKVVIAGTTATTPTTPQQRGGFSLFGGGGRGGGGEH